MKKTRRLLALFLTLAMCLTLFSACGGGSSSGDDDSSSSDSSNDGKVYTLTVVNHDSDSSMCEEWLETILGYIEEESDGQIVFEYNAGGSLYGATETIDAVKDGSADICWWTTGSYSGRFLVSEFINLVGNGIDNARLASAVINTMYNEMEEVQDEYSDWKVLALHGTSCSPISTVSKKIESVSDLTNLRLRVAGTVASAYLSALGCEPIAMATSEVYDNLSKNAIDGMCNDWHNIDCFNLYEPINYCMDVSLNMTCSGVLMNQDTYDSLPSDLQALFDKYFASYYAADMAGYYWDSCRYWVADEMEENGVEIYEPSDEVYDYLFSDEVLGAARDTYIGLLDDAGYDGQAIYDECMAIVEELAPLYEDAWDTEFNYADWDVSAEDYQALY